jgi:hypothetical protein
MPITPGQPTHVIVTYADGKLTVYRNGEQAAVINSITGDFSNWDRHTLIFGDEANGGRNWNGTIEGIAIYDRPLTAEQVQQHWQAVRAKQAARPDITPTQIKAKLVAASEAPTLKQIAPYREALIVHEYQVLEHLAGPQPNAQRIRVVDWAMLDGDKQRGAKPGGKPTAMTVEPFDAQPQLKSLYMADTLELDIETPMYYRVDR